MIRHEKIPSGVLGRVGLGALLLLVMLVLGVVVARAGELIPSLGVSRSTSGNQEAKVNGGLALRGDLAPFLKDEIAVSYRSESTDNGLLQVRMWPVTTSLWFAPVPMLYAGGGVGLYSVTYDYNQTVLGSAIQDETKQQFGVHLGGGLRVPLAPVAAVDLNARYVMMRDQQSHLVPDHFQPDYLNMAVGLALRF